MLRLIKLQYESRGRNIVIAIRKGFCFNKVFMASKFLAVSFNVSPFLKLEDAEATLNVSALSRFAASSNDALVLVDGSQKRFTNVFPRKAGTLGMSLRS